MSSRPLSFRCSSLALHHKTHRNLSAHNRHSPWTFFVRSNKKKIACRSWLSVIDHIAPSLDSKETEIWRFRSIYIIHRFLSLDLQFSKLDYGFNDERRRQSSTIPRMARANQSVPDYARRCGTVSKDQASILAFTHDGSPGSNWEQR